MSNPEHIGSILGRVVPKFQENERFKRDYDFRFEQDPGAANLFLLLRELADERGRIKLANPERKLVELMAVRFHDPEAYQL